MKSFRIGGIHPPENKISRQEAIEIFPIPTTVTIPVSQHIGAPAIPCVAKGDTVKVGQVIAQAAGFVSSNIHSSVSGTVTAVDTVLDGGNLRKMAITIAVQGDEWMEDIDRSDKIVYQCALNAKEIVAKITAAGIVGMGGATFPTQVKLSVPEGKKAKYLIINGVECEPYLTSDYRLMMEYAEQVLVGVSILAKALGVKQSFVAIENNKKDAIAHLGELAKKYPEIEVVALKVKYPQGGEKQLIDAVVSRQVPSCGLPIDVGCVVQNVGTAVAVYQAVQKNKPLFERVVTVTGKELPKRANYMVRIGTAASELLTSVGGAQDAGKIINGGPMMGKAMANIDAPVTKGTSGILVMSTKEAARRQDSSCIKCAKCVNVCPMALEPYLLAKLGGLGRMTEAEPHRVVDCVECGSCSFVCPASLPLLDNIRLAKSEVLKLIRNRCVKCADSK